MAIHQAPDGSLHDDMDGAAIDYLPAGCVQITDEEAEEIRAAQIIPPDKRELAKIARSEAVAAIVVEVNGKSFNGDETSQNRMARAILALTTAGQTDTQWALADNSFSDVTLQELQEALALAGAEQTRLWALP